ASSLANDIELTKTSEASHDLGFSLGGEVPGPIGGVVAHVTPSINSGLGKREVVTEKLTQLAPKHVVVASGTVDEEHGVFFKLRPTPQTTIEGVHEFTVQFLVPAKWRADAVRVKCQASGVQKFLWVKQQKVWASENRKVALYMAGDEQARIAAERHMRRGI
ncbi:MAG: hypothetical protein AAF961_14665, partial [Planctomycetota bacterium]